MHWLIGGLALITFALPPAIDPIPPAREDPAVVRRPHILRGLIVPVAGVAVPTEALLLPNAERAYRAGSHEGIDFAAPAGTPALATADGVIVRIDSSYRKWTDIERRLALEEAVRLGYTPGPTLDRIRGRQVWIDHGRGVVTRYAHLSRVADLPLGAEVHAGDIIGAVGSSGLPEGGPHLHFEVRLGDDYLGDGLTGDTLRRTIDLAFR